MTSNDTKNNEQAIISVEKLLGMNLIIPRYQRPYKWTTENIQELLTDIENAIRESEKYDEFRYRLGTVVLYTDIKSGKTEVVDGQQRIISLVLIMNYIKSNFECKVSKESSADKITIENINLNYSFIADWFGTDEKKKEKFQSAIKKILEIVVICVGSQAEAFQFFDSQNTRGKALYPHDLLKAYHLREMNGQTNEMRRAVEKWEEVDSAEISNLFSIYLYPIWNWSNREKSDTFTDKKIDTYKGIPEQSTYSYAKRTNKAMPCFQITEPFTSGNEFFEYVHYYRNMLCDIKNEILTNKSGIFKNIRNVICKGTDSISNLEELDSLSYGTGFRHALNLFYCALMCYYDKFHNFDEQAVKKIFCWAFMIRLDMEKLGYATINKYAIGESNGYSNAIAMFYKIDKARKHTEISSLQIELKDKNKSENNISFDVFCNKLKKTKDNEAEVTI